MKQALCILRDRAPACVLMERRASLVTIPPDFFLHAVPFLVPREIAETDERFLQLLPYVTVRSRDGRVFVYSRGTGSAEARLVGNLSIGVGGHVEAAPDEVGPQLLSLLESEANRELAEEIGLSPKPLTFTHFIVDPTNAVGRVHLGLYASVEFLDFETMAAELGIIEHGRFATLAELAEGDQFDRLENWSRLIVGNFAGQTIFDGVIDRRRS